jgi:hypothetical protein
MTAPIPVLVRRFACPHCRYRRAKRDAVAAHIGRCWFNPANRTCKTCKHFEPVACCGMADVYGCYTPMCPTDPTCAAGVELDADPPNVDCGRWELDYDSLPERAS